MIAKYNRVSLFVGIPGLILKLFGLLFQQTARNIDHDQIGSLLILLGTITLVIGLCFYAKAKGHSARYGIMGIFPVIGIIYRACLKTAQNPTHQTTRKPTTYYKNHKKLQHNNSSQ